MSVSTELLEFMLKTAETLARIEASQAECKGTLEKQSLCIDDICKKIPVIETGLSNHIHTHDKIMHKLIFPLVVLGIAGLGAVLFKVIFHIKWF